MTVRRNKKSILVHGSRFSSIRTSHTNAKIAILFVYTLDLFLTHTYTLTHLLDKAATNLTVIRIDKRPYLDKIWFDDGSSACTSTHKTLHTINIIRTTTYFRSFNFCAWLTRIEKIISMHAQSTNTHFVAAWLKWMEQKISIPLKDRSIAMFMIVLSVFPVKRNRTAEQHHENVWHDRVCWWRVEWKQKRKKTSFDV